MHYEEIWRFDTARYTVALEVAPEDMDPADSFEFPEDIEAVRSGAVEWFTARVAVYRDGAEVAADYLGGCAYRTFEEFYTSHRDPDPMNRNCTLMRAAHPAGPNVTICHYFPGMVAEAVRMAREAERRAVAAVVPW